MGYDKLRGFSLAANWRKYTDKKQRKPPSRRDSERTVIQQTDMHVTVVSELLILSAYVQKFIYEVCITIVTSP